MRIDHAKSDNHKPTSVNTASVKCLLLTVILTRSCLDIQKRSAPVDVHNTESVHVEHTQHVVLASAFYLLSCGATSQVGLPTTLSYQ